MGTPSTLGGEISPELAAKLEGHLIPLCRARGCEKLEGHEDDHGPIVLNMAPIAPNASAAR